MFQFNIMAIQDPFVMTHNVTGNVNEKTLHLIRDQLQQASAKCKNTKFSQKSPNSEWGLCYLWSPSRILIQNPIVPSSVMQISGSEVTSEVKGQIKPGQETDFYFRLQDKAYKRHGSGTKYQKCPTLVRQGG